MTRKNPYSIILKEYVTEKSMVLAGLEKSTSNACTSRCSSPKAMFIVDVNATKPEIASAIEEIYSERGVKVVKVNTLRVPRKQKQRRGVKGFTAGFKKAIVTFEPGDSIENV